MSFVIRIHFSEIEASSNKKQQAAHHNTSHIIQFPSIRDAIIALSQRGCLLIAPPAPKEMNSFPHTSILALKIEEQPHQTKSPTPPASPGTITLPPDVCQIRPNEPLQTFIKRIQIVAITAATEAEGNHTRAARRLGYSRTSMVHLIQKIRRSEEKEPKRTNKQKPTN